MRTTTSKNRGRGRRCVFCGSVQRLTAAGVFDVCDRCAAALGEFISESTPSELAKIWTLEDQPKRPPISENREDVREFLRSLDAFSELTATEATHVVDKIHQRYPDVGQAAIAYLAAGHVELGSYSKALRSASEFLTSQGHNGADREFERAAKEACLTAVFSRGFFRATALGRLKKRVGSVRSRKTGKIRS